MTKVISSEQSVAITRISGLVLINAMVFQEILSESEPSVLPLQKIVSSSNPINNFSENWKHILEDINFYPIFHISLKILEEISSTNTHAILGLAKTAQEILSKKAALRHDLMGRIYHRLLVEKKFLGTFYTRIPSATLLLKLCLRPEGWKIKWENIKMIRDFRVADLACGTGTLLMAAADGITDNYIHESAKVGNQLKLRELQRTLAEEVLYGYDVLASAIHLTASTLALRAPEISFRSMNLYNLPLGGKAQSLGSIEYFKDSQIEMSFDLFGAMQVTGKGEKKIFSASIPMLDLCVMNPPFTRSVGGNLLFGSVPEKEREKMQKKLAGILKKYNVSANSTAGLGSVFVALADPYIKKGGRIGLVLPKAILSGVAWEKTRDLLGKHYHIEFLVSSHDPERWNFSESTSLSEILIVAQKQFDETQEPLQTAAINLWRNPDNNFEALTINQELRKNSLPDIERIHQGSLELFIGENKVGEAIAVNWNRLKKQKTWIYLCAFAQSDLIRTVIYLQQGNLRVPGHSKMASIPLCPLNELGSIGPDRRDIHDGFNLSKVLTPFAAFWGHDAQKVLTLAQEPNQYLSPLSKAKPGRNLRPVNLLWPKAGRILIAERIRINSQRLLAILSSKEVLSNVWWPFALHENLKSLEYEKVLTLWLNSTLGVLISLSLREETEGAWIDFKKPILEGMPVLDLRKIPKSELNEMAAIYDHIANIPILPFPGMDVDPVRKQIDESIVNLLNLPDFSILRKMLVQEPVVCIRRL